MTPSCVSLKVSAPIQHAAGARWPFWKQMCHRPPDIPTVDMKAAVWLQRQPGDLGCGGGDERLAVRFEEIEARLFFRLLRQQSLEGKPVHGAGSAMAGNGKTQGIEPVAPFACGFHIISQRRNA